MSRVTVYEIITNRIIEELKKGTIPWKKPWKTSMPQNLVSKKEYRGINTLTLSMTPFSSPYFATIKQVNQLGGKVKKGSKGMPVVFWKPQEVESDSMDTKTSVDKSPMKHSRAIMRYYKVFNTEQCEGLESKIPAEESITFNPIEECEKVVENYPGKPSIEHSGQRACYRPATDVIFMPLPESFESSAHYYGTLFHECIHSTGNEKRLGREGVKNLTIFNNHMYSKEELIAEIGSSFLCGKTGINVSSVFNNQIAYISSWLEALKNDKRMVIHAAAQAQKAVDYILNVNDHESENSKEIDR
jgi:antirestriction protein ArdC